jgi:hypothetical protein
MVKLKHVRASSSRNVKIRFTKNTTKTSAYESLCLFFMESDNSDGYTVSVDLLNADKNDKALQQRCKRVYSRRCSQSVRRHLDAAEDYINNAVTQFTFPKRS